MKATSDRSITTGISEATQIVLAALEDFIKFPDQDRAATEYAQWMGALNEPLPEKGAGPEETLKVLRDVVIPAGGRLGAPGFAGWVTTMPTVVPAVAAFTASIAGPQRWWHQSFNYLEYLALEWLKKLLGIPASYQGTFSSGGSIANLIGIGAARQYAYEQRGIDPSETGLAGIPKPRLYASNQIHHVAIRAAAVLGLGRSNVVQLPTDEAFRLDVNALRTRLKRDMADGCTPIAVLASAGTVNMGAVDPIREILEICRAENIWLHVDGAYGGFGILDPQAAPQFDGMTEADSIAVDQHKWMAVPLGCGATFVRDQKILRHTFTLEPAEYLEGSAYETETIGSQFDGFGYGFDQGNNIDFNLEQSARSRGATVWAALKEMGAEGMRERVIRHNGFARHLGERVKASPVLELLAPVSLSICCFRYVPDELRGKADAKDKLNELNREIVKRLHAGHRHIPSSTEINGAFAIRPCYINPRTTLAEVDGLADEVERIGAEVWGKGNKIS
jgi:aromatic-L-amino-acid decarboxylase